MSYKGRGRATSRRDTGFVNPQAVKAMVIQRIRRAFLRAKRLGHFHFYKTFAQYARMYSINLGSTRGYLEGYLNRLLAPHYLVPF